MKDVLTVFWKEIARVASKENGKVGEMAAWKEYESTAVWLAGK